MLNEREKLIWLAGYLEGEGCFRLTRDLRGRPDPLMHPRVQLCATDRDVVERVVEYLGGGIRIHDRAPRSKGWRPQYCIYVTSDRAVDLMRALLPYMGARRSQQIRDVLDGDTRRV